MPARSGDPVATTPPAAEPAAGALVPLNKVPQFRELGRATVWRFARTGALRTYRIAGRIYTTGEDVSRFLADAAGKAVSRG